MNNLTGVEEFKAILEKVEKIPAKTMTASVKKVALIARNEARANAPKDSGDLRRSIGIWAEKRKVGKKIYQLAFSKNYNDKFVKKTAEGKRYYYPASQEYGFKKRGSGDKVAGNYFIRKASSDKKNHLIQLIINELSDQLRNI